MTSSGVLQLSARATEALAVVPRDAAVVAALTDDELVQLARDGALQQRLGGATVALAAGEIARRSAPSLGHSGLAQRSGHRTPEEFIRVTTGQTGRHAAATVKAGVLALELEGADATRPWLAPVGHAVSSGVLSIDAASAISNGLGSPNAGVSAESLAAAASLLVDLAAELDADRLFKQARQFREDLDSDALVDREQVQREDRTLRFTRLPDGMARLTWLMDPETAIIVGDLVDRATSPRRGGPRFVGERDRATAARIVEDERSNEQLLSDTFVELLRHGADADSSQLLGSGAPVVRILVAAPSLTSPTGRGHAEGALDPVSLAIIEKALCEGSSSEIVFDRTGQPLDVGREQRLFSIRQRKALAARDGGCRFPGCERPPSWCEAHHIKHWSRDRGKTDIADGMLLCRHHHLLLHNNGWEIERNGAEYWLFPPATVDPEQKHIHMTSRSEALKELLAYAAG